MLLVWDHTLRTTSLIYLEALFTCCHSLGTTPWARQFTFLQPREINIYRNFWIRKVRFRQFHSLVQGHTARKGRIGTQVFLSWLRLLRPANYLFLGGLGLSLEVNLAFLAA